MRVLSLSPDILRASKSSEIFPKSNTGNNTPRLLFPQIKKKHSAAIDDEIFPDWLKKRKDFQKALTNYNDIGYGYIARTCEKCHPIRSEVEQSSLISWLRSCNFVRANDDLFLQEISKKLYTKYFNTSDSIITEGEIPNFSYFILDGEVGVFYNTRKVSVKKPKDCFGDSDFSPENFKNYGYTALTPVVALVIKSENYQDIIQNTFNSQKMLILNFLKKMPIFKNILYNKLEELSERSQIVDYGNEEIIYNIEDLANDFFIVKNGIVELETCVTLKQKRNLPIKKTIVSTQKFLHKIRICNAGEAFGTEEVLNKSRRYAKAVSKEKNTCCIVINQRDFFSVLSPQEIEEISKFFEPRLGSKELRRRVTRELSGKRNTVNAIFDAARISPMAGCFSDRKIHRKVDWANKIMERYKNSISSRLLFENHEILAKNKNL